jgi:hypothetical protein
MPTMTLVTTAPQPQWGDVAPDPELDETVLSGTSNLGGDIKIAALKLPGILAETIRDLINRGRHERGDPPIQAQAAS